MKSEQNLPKKNRQSKNISGEEKQNENRNSQKTYKSCGESENSTVENWQKDIETHDYYYDDSHGYKIYNPEIDDEENDDN